jgi:hypothetical protein
VVDENSIPTEYDNIHTAESKPVVSIITPTENSTFSKTDNITVSFNFQGMYPLQKADIFINGIFITNLSGQNTYTFSPQEAIRMMELLRRVYELVEMDHLNNSDGEFNIKFPKNLSNHIFNYLQSKDQNFRNIVIRRQKRFRRRQKRASKRNSKT